MGVVLIGLNVARRADREIPGGDGASEIARECDREGVLRGVCEGLDGDRSDSEPWVAGGAIAAEMPRTFFPNQKDTVPTQIGKHTSRSLMRLSPFCARSSVSSSVVVEVSWSSKSKRSKRCVRARVHRAARNASPPCPE